MPRTSIPNVGRAAEHNFYDFRQYIPTTGNIWFCDSGAASGGNGLTPEGAVTTIDAANNLTTASNGDIVYIAEGHAETISGAGTLTADVAGITFQGLGFGRTRPVFTWSATNSQVVVSAANVVFRNLVFDLTGIDAVVAGFAVDAADVSFYDCEFLTNSGTAGVVSGITVGAATTSPRFQVINCRFRGPATNTGTTTTAQITLTDCPDYEIRDSYFTGKCTQNITNGAAILRGEVAACRFVTYTGTKSLNFHASSTPFITNNRFNVPSGTAPIVAAAGFVAGNVYSAAAGVTAGTASTF